MNAALRIRPFEERDRAPMHRALITCGVFSDAEITVALELMDIALTQPEQRDYHLVACADSDDSARGYLCIGKRPMTHGTFDMYWIVVDPAMHGSGVGTLLNDYAERFTQEHDGYLLIAETSSKASYEPTRKFYLARQYSELARIKDCYAHGDDLIIYGKYLSSLH